MHSGEPAAVVTGLIPPGSRVPETVPLHPGQVWRVGRHDAAHLRANHLTERHLAVPNALRDLSVTELTLDVRRAIVLVSHHLGGPVVVDGLSQLGPAVLSDHRYFVNPTVPGDAYVDFVVHLRPDDLPASPLAVAPSGTTVVLKIALTPGTTRWVIAHALAWPILGCARQPHNTGWSGRDVLDRLGQLGWALPGGGRLSVTRVGKELLELADLVADARLSTGQRAVDFFTTWPTWVAAVKGETPQQAAARRNQSVAVELLKARAVSRQTIDGP